MSAIREWSDILKSFPADTPPVVLELLKWRNYDLIKNPEFERWEALRNCCVMLIPDLRQNYNPWFERACRTYAENSYVAALGCGNSGKTWDFHTLAFVDYMSDPFHTQVICTTTSQAGLDTRMWPILSAHFRALRPADWKIVNNPRKMIMANRDDPKHTIRAVVIEERADKSKITDNIIGAHTDRVIWIVDEATSAPEAVFDAWSNLAGGTIHRRLIMLGNPIDQLDTLGRFCRPEIGWDSVNVNTEQWSFEYMSEKGIGLHFDGEKSPNLVHPVKTNGSSRWSFLFGHFDYKRHKAEEPEDPMAYWRFCRGWFADASLVPKVMISADLDASRCRDKTVFYGTTSTFASLDPAYGGDRPSLKVWKKGVCSESQLMVMEQIADYIIPLRPGCLPGKAIGDYVLQKALLHGFKVIGIDTTTDNSAPAEYLKLNSTLEVMGVDFGGRASELSVSPTDTMRCCDKYDRKVTELWFTIKRILRQIRGLDEETCIELCTRYYERIGKPEKLCVETKKKMKERSHGKSPDKADSVAIGVQVFRHLGGFELPQSKSGGSDFKKMAKRRGQLYSSGQAYSS